MIRWWSVQFGWKRLGFGGGSRNGQLPRVSLETKLSGDLLAKRSTNGELDCVMPKKLQGII